MEGDCELWLSLECPESGSDEYCLVIHAQVPGESLVDFSGDAVSRDGSTTALVVPPGVENLGPSPMPYEGSIDVSDVANELVAIILRALFRNAPSNKFLWMKPLEAIQTVPRTPLNARAIGQ